MSERYDAIVIGTGQAGPALAVRLAKAGRKTAIIERKRIGGTCVNNGCIPTKTLIASARAAHVARTAGGWGVIVPPGVEVDMRAVKARKDGVVHQSNHGVASWLRATPGVTLIEAHARFESPVPCGPETLCSKRRRFSSTPGDAPMSRLSPASIRFPISTTYR